MNEMNRVSANYWDRRQHIVALYALQRLAKFRDMVTEGGRMYGQVKLSKGMQQARQVVNTMPPEVMYD